MDSGRTLPVFVHLQIKWTNACRCRQPREPSPDAPPRGRGGRHLPSYFSSLLLACEEGQRSSCISESATYNLRLQCDPRGPATLLRVISLCSIQHSHGILISYYCYSYCYFKKWVLCLRVPSQYDLLSPNKAVWTNTTLWVYLPKGKKNCIW